jgi:DNA-binding transcriptional ArsR family regulator
MTLMFTRAAAVHAVPLLLTLGGATLLTGAWTLPRFLRHHPMAESEVMSDTPSYPEIDLLIHAPARLKIIAALELLEEGDFLYLRNLTGLTKGNLSAHLSKLERGGFVEIEKGYRGRLPLTLCRLIPAGRNAFRRYRRDLIAFLSAGVVAPVQADRASA